MPTINNINDLEEIIQAKLSLALKFTQQEVYKIIQKNIKNYYEEKVFYNRSSGNMSNIPNVYDRTYQFLNSLIKTEVTIENGIVSCSVKIDTDSLNYVQDANIVIDMINRGYHADKSINNGTYETPRNIYSKSHFWDDGIQELGGYYGILEIMKKNCEKVGIPIK